MSDIVKGHSLASIKNALSLHVLLDYFDTQKLHKIANGTTLSTTLYQTTGNAPGNIGFVNITDLKGGKVGFGSAVSGSELDSSYSKSVKEIPYNISVIEIDDPIIAPGIFAAEGPSGSVKNLTALLEKAGCKTFAGLLVSSGVIKTYESAVDKGLTVFAPNDEAFKSDDVPDLTKLSNADLVALLEYHALNGYNPEGTLKTTKDPLPTLASNGVRKFDISFSTAGDEVTLHTGVAPSRLADTVLDATPLAIFSVDSVLLPSELFGKAPSPSPVEAPKTSPSPAPTPRSASPAPSEAPVASPPAPPAETPGDAPADSPNGSEDSKSQNAGVHVRVSVPAIFVSMVAVACSIFL